MHNPTSKPTVENTQQTSKRKPRENHGNLPQGKRSKDHTRPQWIAKFSETMVCYYCQTALTISSATKDHKTPTCRGGSNGIHNIVPACKTCNSRKSWRTEREFRKVQEKLVNRARLNRGIPFVKSFLSLEEMVDEPRLLETLVRERERVSWAWRNPAYYLAEETAREFVLLEATEAEPSPTTSPKTDRPSFEGPGERCQETERTDGKGEG